MPVSGQTPTRIHLVDSPSAKWTAGAAYPDPNDPSKLVRDVDARVTGEVDVHTSTSVTIDASSNPVIALGDASPAGAISVSLDSTVEDGFIRDIFNESANTATLTPTSGDINDGTGAGSSVTLAAGTSCRLSKTSSGSPAVAHWRMLKGAGSGGGTSSPLTTTGDLWGYGGSPATDARVPVGSNGQVLTADSSQANGVKWATPSAGSGFGGLVLLEEHTANAGDASIDFITRNVSGQSGATFQSDFDDYIFRIIKLKPTTAGVDMCMQVSTNGGAVWDATSNVYYWWWQYVAFDGANGIVNTPSGDGQVKLFTTSTEVSGQLDVLGAGHGRFLLKVIAFSNVSHFNYTASGAGLYNSSSTVNAMRFFAASSSTLAGGTIRCYGVAK